jgi:fucose permease
MKHPSEHLPEAPEHKQVSALRAVMLSPLLLRLQLALAFLAFILIGASDGALGVLLPSVSHAYGVNKAEVGLLFLMGAIGYITAALSCGLLIERLGHRLSLVIGLAVYALAVGTFSLAPPFGIILIAGVVLGFGAGSIDAGLNAYIALLPKNTTKLNYLHAFYGIGAWLGPLVATAVLAQGLEWNRVYNAWLLLSVFLLVGVGLFFRDRLAQSAQAEPQRAGGNVLAAALKLRVVWLGAFFLLLYVGSEVSLSNWGYSFLTEWRHQPAVLSGASISGYWLGLTLGRLTLANLAGRVGQKRLIQGCIVGVVLGILLIWLAPTGVIAAAGLFLTGFSLGPIFPTTIALMSTLVPARVLPSAIGFLASLGSMGAAFFPWLAGALAQQVGLWSLLPYVIGLTLVMLGLWLALQRQRPTLPVGASERV